MYSTLHLVEHSQNQRGNSHPLPPPDEETSWCYECLYNGIRWWRRMGLHSKELIQHRVRSCCTISEKKRL